MQRLFPFSLCLCAAFAAAAATAQIPHPGPPTAALTRCLVLPFTNRSGNANLDWMGESFVVAFRQGLRGSGITVLDRADRRHARDLLGAPAGVILSHASLMRLAREADARWLVLGWFDDDGEQLSASASLIDLQREHLVHLTTPAEPERSLQDLEASLGSALRQRLDPGATGQPAPHPPMPLSAYEDYVRSRLAPTAADQVQLLRVAAQLAPTDNRILLALGQAYFRDVMDAPAASVLEKIPASAPEYPEAVFTSGLAEYGLGHYSKAIALWRLLEKNLPLPAVVHNLAVAQAAAAGSQKPGALALSFPLEQFLQLQRAVASFAARKLAPMSPRQKVDYELQTGEHLFQHAAWAAAADAFQKVVALAASLPGPDQAHPLGAAHAGLAAIWYARHDNVQAAREAAAALAADPTNAQAQQLQRKLAPRPHL
ncbi:MAG: hypothetical protein ACRD1F_04930 [Terriglobales bacterium]